MKADILSQVPLFTALPREEIDYLAQTLRECDVPAGEVLFREGESSDHFFILFEGEAEIVKFLGLEEERILAMNGKGAMLGEMSLFSQAGTHTASVRAHTPMKLLEMTLTQFDALLHRQPDLAFHLLRLFSRRLVESENLTIRDLREKNRELTQAYQELKAAQAQIIEKKKMERELEIASQFQQNILPQRLPRITGYDIGALMIPARAVGGDFYDFIPLDGNRMGIVIGDVVDKGLPAALLMTMSYSAIRTEAVRGYSPGDALRAMNHHLLNFTHSYTYVTLLYGILNSQTHQFTYARAAHPYPIVLDADHHPLEISSNTGQPIGMFDSPLFDEQCLTIPPGGTLLLFSDGLSETIEARDASLTVENLCYSLMEERSLRAQELCSGLWEATVTSDQESYVQDDFTVVAVQRGPA